MTRTIRLFSLILVSSIVLTMALTNSASAQSTLTKLPLQATPEVTPTEINLQDPLPLKVGTPATSPLDKDVINYRLFGFAGKANQYVMISVAETSGNFGFKVTVNSQNDQELAFASGVFVDSVALTIKLPQDGKYIVRVESSDPGAGDFEKGSVSVSLAEGKSSAIAATPAATATK